MRVDETTLARVRELSEKYKQTWGQPVDYSVVPRGLSQERLVEVLEYMIETNDSLLVAYGKLFGTN